MDWRQGFNEDSEFRQRVDRRIAEQVAIQKARGLTKYGPDFVGDTWQHAFEEAVGLMTYIATLIEARDMAMKVGEWPCECGHRAGGSNHEDQCRMQGCPCQSYRPVEL